MSSLHPPFQTLRGTIERITFYNEENGYMVARFLPEGKENVVTVVGNMMGASVGESRRYCQDRRSATTAQEPFCLLAELAERSCVDAVLRARGDERLGMDGMYAGFLGSDEARPQADAVRAGRENGRHRPAGADASGREQRHRRHDVEHLAEQIEQPDGAAHVSDRADGLHHDEIAPGDARDERFVTGAHRPRRERSMIVNDPRTRRVR